MKTNDNNWAHKCNKETRLRRERKMFVYSSDQFRSRFIASINNIFYSILPYTNTTHNNKNKFSLLLKGSCFLTSCLKNLITISKQIKIHIWCHDDNKLYCAFFINKKKTEHYYNILIEFFFLDCLPEEFQSAPKNLQISVIPFTDSIFSKTTGVIAVSHHWLPLPFRSRLPLSRLIRAHHPCRFDLGWLLIGWDRNLESNHQSR